MHPKLIECRLESSSDVTLHFLCSFPVVMATHMWVGVAPRGTKGCRPPSPPLPPRSAPLLVGRRRREELPPQGPGLTARGPWGLSLLPSTLYMLLLLVPQQRSSLGAHFTDQESEEQRASGS